MAGAFKKTMIYLGLADGDDYPDESFGHDQSGTSTPQESSVKRSEGSVSSVQSGSGGSRHAVRTPSSANPADSSVVSLKTGAINSGTDADPAGQYNDSNLAVAPDYRATVTPIKRAPSSRDENSPMRKITTVHPRSYNDAKIIGESFRDNIPVIMNVTDMGESEAKRLVDFSAGLVFGLGGSIERVTNKVFLLSPRNVEVLAEERESAEPSSTAHFFNQS